MCSNQRDKLVAVIFLASAIFSSNAYSAQTDRTSLSISHILSKGINITDWFRNPISKSATSLESYISDADIDQLARVGFTYIRIPMSPDVMSNADGTMNVIAVRILQDAARRIEQRGLGVMLVPMHDQWNLESNPSDRDTLVAFWKNFSPYLVGLDVELTFPELLNEPVFPVAKDWNSLEQELLSIVRSRLPHSTVVLAGNQWGSIAGLIASQPLVDSNVVYSFHYYNPTTLTSHGSWDKMIDGTSLKRLPFPGEQLQDCHRVAAAAIDQRAKDLGNLYCDQNWNLRKISKEIATVKKWSKLHRVIVVATEFGIMADHERQSRLRYLRAVRASCEKNGIGWGLWGYDDGYGFAINPKDLPSKPTLDISVLSALGLTNP